MLPDSINKCPHCGSTEGYYFDRKMKYVQTKGFGNREEDDVAGELEAIGKDGACRCESCKKIIKKD